MKEHYTECWTYPREVIDEMFHELTAEDVGALPADTKAIDIGALPADTKVIDISDKFAYQMETGSGLVVAYYDPASKTVRGNYTVYNNTTNITTSTAIFKITDEKYIPKEAHGYNLLATTSSSSALQPYFGRVTKEGDIVQSLSGSARNIYATFEYII